MIESILEEVRVVMFGEESILESVAQTNCSWEESFQVECLSFIKEYIGTVGDSNLSI